LSGDRLATLVVDGYLEQLAGWAGDLHWTWAVVDSLVRDKPELAWPILLEVMERVPDGNLNVLSAGPLEDYLGNHGPRVIHAVEAEAAANLRLRQALAMMWQGGMTDDVWQRVQAIADPSLAMAMDLEPSDGWERRGIDVWLADAAAPGIGLPDDGWLDRLLNAARDAKRDGTEAWSTPVSVELSLWTGPAASFVPPVELLAAVVERLESGGVIADRRLVRTARLTDLRGPAPLVHLEVRLLVDEQVDVFDNVEPFDELLAADEIEAMRAELEASRPLAISEEAAG